MTGAIRTFFTVGGLISLAILALVVIDVRSGLDSATSPNAQTTVSDPAKVPVRRPRAEIGLSGSLRFLEGRALEGAVERLRGAGVRYSREDLDWSLVERVPGSYDWSAYDAMVLASARRGLRIIALPNTSPSWTGLDEGVAPSEGDPLKAFQDFLAAAIRRYGSRGTLWAANPTVPKQPITVWNLWNEPYGDFRWDPPDPAAYARFFKEAARAGSAAGDPQARFMAEVELYAIEDRPGEPRPYLEAMFEAVPDLARHMDMASVHPYTREDPASGGAQSPTVCSYPGNGPLATVGEFCRVRTVRDILDRRGASRTDLWITEIGWSTAPDTDDGRAVTEEVQAERVHEAFAEARRSGVVDGLVWYAYRLGEADPADVEEWFGLVHEGDTAADPQVKPGWDAFVEEVARGL